MTSIVAHKILQALLMLATSDICPETEWYGEELAGPDVQHVDIAQCFVKSYHSEPEAVSCARPHHRKTFCPVPLADGMSAQDAQAFYKVARRMARGK